MQLEVVHIMLRSVILLDQCMNMLIVVACRLLAIHHVVEAWIWIIYRRSSEVFHQVVQRQRQQEMYHRRGNVTDKLESITIENTEQVVVRSTEAQVTRLVRCLYILLLILELYPVMRDAIIHHHLMLVHHLAECIHHHLRRCKHQVLWALQEREQEQEEVDIQMNALNIFRGVRARQTTVVHHLGTLMIDMEVVLPLVQLILQTRMLVIHDIPVVSNLDVGIV